MHLENKKDFVILKNLDILQGKTKVHSMLFNYYNTICTTQIWQIHFNILPVHWLLWLSTSFTNNNVSHNTNITGSTTLLMNKF